MPWIPKSNIRRIAMADKSPTFMVTINKSLAYGKFRGEGLNRLKLAEFKTLQMPPSLEPFTFPKDQLSFLHIVR
jgi:hypothetical protein